MEKMKRIQIMMRIIGIVCSESNLKINIKEKKVEKRKLQEKDKFCFILLHDEKSSYDKNFYDAANDICNEFNVEAVIRTDVEEGEGCYNATKELINMGCKGIFADSFGHEDSLIRAAKESKNIEFGHATGTKAHTEKLNNFHNAFSSIYEGRYVTGIAAGMKLNEMIRNGNITAEEAKAGYVGAFPYAEVVSGYTAFYLGIKSVCESATMSVRYTNSWYDEEGEKNVAEQLIDIDKCKVISQHADSPGVPTVCENKGIPNVFYNGENPSLKNSYLISSRINWRPYFRYFINSTLNNKTMEYDWVGNLTNGAVEIYNASSLASQGTQSAVDKAIADLKQGTLKVFNTSKFTVSNQVNNLVVDGNKHVTSYKADVDTDNNFEGDTEVISNGYFHESEYRSAPYFDLRIDGITEIFNDNNETSISNYSYSPHIIQKNNNSISSGAICAIIIPSIAILILFTIITFILKAKTAATMSTVSLAKYPLDPIQNSGNSTYAFNIKEQNHILK